MQPAIILQVHFPFGHIQNQHNVIWTLNTKTAQCKTD